MGTQEPKRLKLKEKHYMELMTGMNFKGMSVSPAPQGRVDALKNSRKHCLLLTS